VADIPLSGEFAPALTVRTGGTARILSPGPTYLVGRDPECDIVINDARVSWRHAALSLRAGRWVLADNGSTNGTFAESRRVDLIEITAPTLIRLGHSADAPVLDCTVGDAAPLRQERSEFLPEQPNGHTQPPAPPLPPAPPATGKVPVAVLAATAPADGEGHGPLEIPYAIRWLVPRGERFANFDILNDNDSQLDYYRRFGHIYAVGIPTKKWRLVVVSDPVLLDEVAGNEEQFGKRVEEINFFAQLSNSRGGGISVIGDGEHYDQVRRVMLPWYAPSHQRTQLERMKDQARKLVADWAAAPAGTTFDARTWMERYALEVSGRGACAYDFGLLGHGGHGDPHPFAAAVPASTKESIRRVADPSPDFTVFARRAARQRRQQYRRHNAELYKTAGALVAARQHGAPLGQQTDLLSRLVSTPDPETGQLLDAETIRDQVLMHLSNGFNGPSITGAWLAYLLATHPDVEAKLIAEIDGITGGDPDYDLRYDDLFNLTYTTQVIKETMRIYPPQPVTIRRSLKDGMLGRYRVRKDDIILVGSLAAQRDPRYWGPDPDRFDPEQFAIEKVVDRPRHAFIPFSVGKRQCMAQEVTFMMLRVVLFEIYRNFQLRLAPGATVIKNTVVTTKPAEVPIIVVPRLGDGSRPVVARAPAVARDRPRAAAPAPDNDWGDPTQIPETSAYRHLVIAYGSNFGANKMLAERFAERADFQGYTSLVTTLNNLAAAPPPPQPWLLVVMTSTYTSNPPSNATAFKAWLERTPPGIPLWQNCRYLVWGTGNSQWNAFLAFPRYLYAKLAELGATPLAEFAYGDVGTPVWERRHGEWNAAVWPVLLELSGARRTQAAAARVAADSAAAGALTGTDSQTAMHMSLYGGDDVSGHQVSVPSLMRFMGTPPGTGTTPRVLLAPVVLTNAVGKDTVEARAVAGRELQAAQSPRRTRHLELALPPGVSYRAGDHLGICPKNDEERVEWLARRLGAALDGLFMAPKTMNVRAVPKGVVLQVRNVLTNLVDISGRPTVALIDLMIEKAEDPDELSRLMDIRHVLHVPDGPASPLRAAVDAGGYDVLTLLHEFPSCRLNLFEFLQVAQPLKPRYYSTSSSPRVHGEGVAHVTVGLETAPVPGRPDREFVGLSSHYVHALRKGDRLNVFIEGADGFHLQEDVARPMIFVSVGTGFAPMRALCWERLALRRAGAPLGEAALFNGIRSSRLDYVYRDEIERFTAEGVLDHVYVATSREQPDRRDHVQDRIREQGALVWRLFASGGYVYVCGSQPMREAVRAAFVDVIADHGALPRERAEAYLADMETTARYRPDLWG
jgi:cytochrome P450 / NADPH-cytochrome P450 reductase